MSSSMSWTGVPLGRYYRSKDGDDCLPKAWTWSKNAWLYSSAFSAIEMAGRTQPASVPAACVRYFYWVAPATAMGALYAGSSCLAGSIRKKDDPVNHMIGGALTASIVGARYGMGPGYTCAFFFAIAGGFLKFLHQEGLNLIDEPSRKETTHPAFGTRQFGPRTELHPPERF